MRYQVLGPFLLAWLWQRWEIEVAHREMKSGLGVGEMQCWNPCSAILSVQWVVWMDAVLLLAGYRTWGLLDGPTSSACWWKGAKRWSLLTLWCSYRAALWGTGEFRAARSKPASDWWNKKGPGSLHWATRCPLPAESKAASTYSGYFPPLLCPLTCAQKSQSPGYF